LARHGAKALAIGDVNGPAIREAASEIKKSFPNVEVLPLELDVTKEQSIDDAVAQTASKLGRIDYAVNNAGIGGSQALSADHKLADWQRVMDINLNGVWMSSRAQIRQMLKQEALEPEYVRAVDPEKSHTDEDPALTDHHGARSSMSPPCMALSARRQKSRPSHMSRPSMP
jgi:NAD(P)-dependent dehydrogenase (short-subunit alcohol dehydrogenase family)